MAARKKPAGKKGAAAKKSGALKAPAGNVKAAQNRVPSHQKKTIAVSGAAGRLGKLLVESLLNGGFRVIAIVRDADSEWELRKHACNIVHERFCKEHADLTFANDSLDNADGLAEKIAGASDFIHLAARIDYKAPLYEMVAANTEPAKVAAQACRKAGARIILISSTSVTRKESPTPINEDAPTNPMNDYGKSKALAEDAVRSSGAAYVIARFPIIYGSGFTEGFSKVLSMAKSGKLQIIGSGDNKISFINAADAISAIKSIIHRPEVHEGTFYFSGKARTQKQVYGVVAGALGVAAPTKHVSKEFAIGALQLRNAALSLIGKTPTMTVENILTLADNREFDCTRAKEAFGWEPKVELSKASLEPYL
jgi:nucleoside-diphosphate-sugar epimerase